MLWNALGLLVLMHVQRQPADESRSFLIVYVYERCLWLSPCDLWVPVSEQWRTRDVMKTRRLLPIWTTTHLFTITWTWRATSRQSDCVVVLKWRLLRRRAPLYVATVSRNVPKVATAQFRSHFKGVFELHGSGCLQSIWVYTDILVASTMSLSCDLESSTPPHTC